MKERKIAFRYAKALFDYAVEEMILEKVNADMETVGNVCKQNRELRLVLQSPIIRKDKKLGILREIFKNHLNQVTMTYLQIIARKSRESYIPDIAISFSELYKVHHNIKTAYLRTAVTVDESVRKRVIAFLEKRTKAHIQLIEEIDTNLIGGFVIKLDDRQYDASILRQLKRLKGEFDVNIYLKGF